MDLVDIADVEAAAARIAGSVVRTPLLPAPLGDGERELLLKPESLQPVGAFKLRGALNTIRALAPERGVVAYSSGNHAQAVAYAARLAGLPAVIVIEDSAPERKVTATRGHGAEVVQVPSDRRESAALELAAERGYTMVAPFDDPHVIAGQGTAGLEIAEDRPDVAAVLVPVSGGGLASGIGVAVKARCPGARVYGVEPELAADTRDGLRDGVRADWPRADRARTIADGLRSQPSALTFEHLRAVLDGVLTVSEAEIRAAVRALAVDARLVAEPSGAVPVAAFLNRAAELPAGPVVAVVSGGNVDPALLAAVLSQRLPGGGPGG